MSGSSKANKIRQIVRLKQIVKRWQRVANGKSSGSGATTGDVPEGFLAVYVGGEMERFIIKTEYLNLPVFKTLLEKAEEEYGFHHSGALRLPIDPPMFAHLASMLDSCEPSKAKSITLQHLLISFPSLDSDCGSQALSFTDSSSSSSSSSLNQLGLRA